MPAIALPRRRREWRPVHPRQTAEQSTANAARAGRPPKRKNGRCRARSSGRPPLVSRPRPSLPAIGFAKTHRFTQDLLHAFVIRERPNGPSPILLSRSCGSSVRPAVAPPAIRAVSLACQGSDVSFVAPAWSIDATGCNGSYHRRQGGSKPIIKAAELRTLLNSLSASLHDCRCGRFRINGTLGQADTASNCVAPPEPARLGS